MLTKEDVRNFVRAAEVSALSIARINKPTCVVCGLYATKATMEVCTLPTGTIWVAPSFCDDCNPSGSEEKIEFQTVEGAPVARRLNRLLKELSGT